MPGRLSARQLAVIVTAPQAVALTGAMIAFTRAVKFRVLGMVENIKRVRVPVLRGEISKCILDTWGRGEDMARREGTPLLGHITPG